jgi:hypothetical protein
MADRGATAAVITEIEKSKNQPFHLIEVEFSVNTFYLTDAYRDIVWDNGGGNHTYIALGHFLSFSDIEETSTVQVSSLTVQLSGIDQTFLSAVLSEYYIDRPLKIYKGFLDDTMAVVADPILIFEGRMDSPIISENPDDGSCILSAAATNTWVDFERLAGRHTNHEEQQIFSELTKEIRWGTT